MGLFLSLWPAIFSSLTLSYMTPSVPFSMRLPSWKALSLSCEEGTSTDFLWARLLNSLLGSGLMKVSFEGSES